MSKKSNSVKISVELTSGKIIEMTVDEVIDFHKQLDELLGKNTSSPAPIVIPPYIPYIEPCPPWPTCTTWISTSSPDSTTDV